ncbi:MAG: NupC/NupG family nucleoside CNT transporter [Planctomycetes bacterium]|nr:NupC/NupG family nucleoside CNT transporter [Planctomycetota bacterium]
MLYLRCALGLLALCGICWLISSERRRFPWRVVVTGLVLQVVLAIWILHSSSGGVFFDGIAGFFEKLISVSRPGSELIFGSLAKPDGPAGFIFAFAGSGLVVIVFFAALMSVLYHLGVMQTVIWILARVMTVFMGVSGSESMTVAAEIFVGQTESPLLVKPYLARMTKSELNAMMTGGYATIAGSVMAVYMSLLGSEYGPHLLTASVMSAPAAFVCAKIIRPETEKSETAGRIPLRIERDASNIIEAAANGTSDGLKLWLNVIAMLIAFTALVALIDWPLGAIGSSLDVEGGLSLSRCFGWVFAPIAWVMGVDGWHDCQIVGSLLGTKISLNEFVAYERLSHILPGSGVDGALEHVRSAKMVTYALCGFANFASIGIQIGGISPLVPERKAEIAALTVKAMIGGAIATCMTATVAGVFL